MLEAAWLNNNILLGCERRSGGCTLELLVLRRARAARARERQCQREGLARGAPLICAFGDSGPHSGAEWRPLLWLQM